LYIQVKVNVYIIQILEGLTQLIRENTGTLLSALFGTFIGAYLAFFFERRHTDKKERSTQISAAKLAQFAITEWLNVAKNMKRNVLDEKRNDSKRHLTLTPFSLLSQFPSLNVDSLIFMLEGEGAQLLNELILSEHKFRTLLGAINQRNQRHELMQHQVATLGPTALDDATLAILKDMTDSIYDLCDDTLSGLQESFDKLHCYIEKKFPGIKALSLDFKY